MIRYFSNPQTGSMFALRLPSSVSTCTVRELSGYLHMPLLQELTRTEFNKSARQGQAVTQKRQPG